MKTSEILEEICNIRDVIEKCYEGLMSQQSDKCLMKAKIAHLLWFQVDTKLEIIENELKKREEICCKNNLTF